MATALSVVTLALEKVAMTWPAGPPANRAAEGLAALNRLLRSLFNSAAWYDHRIDSAFEVPVEVAALRLHCMAGARSVALPKMDSERARDGLRVHVRDASNTATSSNISISGNGWMVNGSMSNLVISTNGADALLMLDASASDWRKCDALEINDQVPFSNDYEEELALILARRWAGARRFGQSLSDDEMRRADDAWTTLRARYVKPPSMAFEAAVSNMGGSCATGSIDDFLNGIV